jgi:hypothetical protein
MITYTHVFSRFSLVVSKNDILDLQKSLLLYTFVFHYGSSKIYEWDKKHVTIIASHMSQIQWEEKLVKATNFLRHLQF